MSDLAYTGTGCSVKLELMRRGNGMVELAFWDYRHGDDRIWELRENGIAVTRTGTIQPVDLVAALRKLVGAEAA